MLRIKLLYRSMFEYLDIQAGKGGDGLAVLERLALVWPERRGEWNEFAARWRKNGTLPPPETLFRAKLRLPVQQEGQRVYPVAAPAEVRDYPGVREIRLTAPQQLCSVEFTGAKPGMYQVLTSLGGSAETKRGEVIIGDDGRGVVSWRAAEADRIRILSNEPKEKISAKTRILAVKAAPELKPDTEMTTFITPAGTLAAWPTTARWKVTEGKLVVDFICRDQPGRKRSLYNHPVYEDDCVQFFLRESPESDGFVQFIVNARGDSDVVLHNRPAPAPAVSATCRAEDGRWHATMTIDLKQLKGSPEVWRMNFCRNQPGVELSSWAELPTEAGFWFLQPRFFVGAAPEK